jgi:sodium transport system permease protein
LYHGETLAPVGAAKVVGGAVLTIYGVQITLIGAGTIELVAAAIAYLAVLVGLVVYVRRAGLRVAHVGLRRPAGVFVAAAIMIGLSAWYVNLVIVAVIEPPGDLSGLQDVVVQTPLLATLLVLGVLPAIAEELVFRGVLTRALATRFGAFHAVGMSAAVFALYHLLPPQMISTFCLGLALGFLTLRARSVVPAMIVHLLNNTIAIIVTREIVPGMATAIEEHAIVMLVVTLGLLGGGIALAAPPLRRSGGAA